MQQCLNDGVVRKILLSASNVRNHHFRCNGCRMIGWPVDLGNDIVLTLTRLSQYSPISCTHSSADGCYIHFTATVSWSMQQVSNICLIQCTIIDTSTTCYKTTLDTRRHLITCIPFIVDSLLISCLQCVNLAQISLPLFHIWAHVIVWIVVSNISSVLIELLRQQIRLNSLTIH